MSRWTLFDGLTRSHSGLVHRSGRGARRQTSKRFVLVALALVLIGWLGSAPRRAGGSTGRLAPAAVGSSRARTPLVIDTDMSWDDVLALTYLLRLPSVEVKAITVSGTGVTDCSPGVQHVRQLLAYLHYPQVPLVCGRTRPLAGSRSFPRAWRRTADSFFGLSLPKAASGTGQRPVTAPVSATQAIAAAFESSPGATFVELGPMTDLAAALTAVPGLGSRIGRVYAMGGTLSAPGNAPGGLAEYNIWIDARAAQVVLDSGVPLSLVPLDASAEVPVTPMLRAALEAHGKVAASSLLAKLLSSPYYYTGLQDLWDPLTAVAATTRGVVTTVHLGLAVDQGSGSKHGRLLEEARGASVLVAVHADARAVVRRFVAVVTGDPGAKVADPASRLVVRFTGSRWSVGGRLPAHPTRVALSLTDLGANPVGILLGRLASGHTLADVAAAIARGATAVPAWLHVAFQANLPGGHSATWGVELTPGLWVVVGGGPSTPVVQLSSTQVSD